MGPKEDVLLGKLAVKHKILTRAQLEKCLHKQKESPHYIPLGAIIVSSGYLSDKGLLKLLALQQKRSPLQLNAANIKQHEKELGSLLLKQKKITAEQLNRCLRIQSKRQRKGSYIPLAKIIVHLGYLQEDEIRKSHFQSKKSQAAAPANDRSHAVKRPYKAPLPVLEVPHELSADKPKVTLYCPQCRRKSYVSRPPAKQFPCKDCGNALILYEDFLFQQQGKPLPDPLLLNAKPVVAGGNGARREANSALEERKTARSAAEESGAPSCQEVPQEAATGEAEDEILDSIFGLDELGLPAPEDLEPLYFGPYRVIQELGRGGMGVVYKAMHKDTRQEVALKVLPRNMVHQSNSIERFHREVHSAARLSHPNIVPILHVGQEHGTYYYVMSLIKGKSLDLLIDEGELSIRDSVEICIKLAKALEYAHSQGIIHRDIKPENIILRPDKEPMITDFGLAKPETSWNLTVIGAAVGTPTYMSPEQARGNPKYVDRRTDIYSLGATLYEMVTLELPFEGRDYHEVVRKVLTQEPEPPRKLCPQIPKNLETIIQKAMEKLPQNRYQQIRMMADELQRFLDGRRIKARPKGLITKTIRSVQIHRERILMILLVILSILFLCAIGLLLWERRQRHYVSQQQGGPLRGQSPIAHHR